MNTLKIGTKVKYAGLTAKVVDHAEPFGGKYPAVVIEYKTSVLGYPDREFIERKTIIEHGLEVAQ